MPAVESTPPEKRKAISAISPPPRGDAAGFRRAVKLIRPAPPNRVVILAGPPDSSFHVTAERYAKLIAAHGIKVEFDTSLRVGTIHTDAHRVEQILINLLSNAIKYNRPGGSVHLDCALLESGRWALRVRDSGRGIPADRLDQHSDLLTGVDAVPVVSSMSNRRPWMRPGSESRANGLIGGQGLPPRARAAQAS